MKDALERLAADWVALAEQAERIDGERPLHEGKVCLFPRAIPSMMALG
jgi:hypothetical protein